MWTHKRASWVFSFAWVTQCADANVGCELLLRIHTRVSVLITPRVSLPKTFFRSVAGSSAKNQILCEMNHLNHQLVRHEEKNATALAGLKWIIEKPAEQLTHVCITPHP